MHVGRHLSDPLAVDAADRHLGLLGIERHSKPGGQRKLDWVLITQGEHHRVLSLQLRAVADPDDFQIAGPAPGDAFHGVVH